MAKCSIQLALDDSKSTYAPGELITGTVVVKVLDPCRCEQLTLGWQWRARGESIRDELHSERLLSLNEGEEWLADQELRYPFRLEAPLLPLTYHGRMMSVDWALRADEACLSSFLELPYRAEVPFLLVLAETRPPAPAATGPGSDSCHALNLEMVREDSMGVLRFVFILGFAALFFRAAPHLHKFPLPHVLPIIVMGWWLISRWWYRKPADGTCGSRGSVEAPAPGPPGQEDIGQ